MFRFEKEQKVFEFGKIKVGGQPGEYPPVLVGTIFYKGHKIVSDDHKGIFDKDKAEELWKMQQEFSDLTGIPCMLQIVGESSEAMKKYIEWFANISDAPFLIDSTDPNVRIAGAKFATEIGVHSRAIYNSINPSLTPQEVEALRNSKIDSAIVLAFNPTDNTVKGRLDILQKGGAGLSKGLLDIAAECGIKRILIDVAATPLGAGAGATFKSVMAVKAKLGLPAGGAPHNIPSAWPWIKKLKKERKEVFPPADIGSNLVMQILGADFLLYGPIENAPMIFPSTAMVSIVVAEAVSELGISVQAENHPIKRLV